MLGPVLIPERLWIHVTHAWFSFFLLTIILVAVLVKMYWPARKSLKLWILMLFLLGMHTVGYVVLLRHVPQWPTYLYLLTIPLEIMFVAATVKACLNILPPNMDL